MQTTATLLEVQNLTKTYEDQPLLRGVSFGVDAGETICLLGRSGSGKSTILRIIAGLEQPESGRVLWNGRDLADVPVHQRGFGLMFQDYALFPHRSVAENVAFGLRMQNLPRAEIAARVQEALEKVNLAAFAGRRVTDLSGGEQQRVALARSLAPRPRLLMLDEPLGALDRTLREQLMDELRRVLHETGIPAIYVTHDQEEAFTFADRLVLLHGGVVEQMGTPAEVYHRPVSPWVAQFFGQTNLLPATIISVEPLLAQTGLGRFRLEQTGAALPGEPVTLLLRPHGARVVNQPGAVNSLRGRVEDVVFRGEGYRVQVRAAAGETFAFLLELAPEPGQDIVLQIDTEAIAMLRPDSQKETNG